MNEVLKLMLEGESLTARQMAKILNVTQEEIDAQLATLEAENVLLGWRPILNPNSSAEKNVQAVIEVRISPEREGGFDRTAERISRFEQVQSCYLISGGYDLLVFAKGRTLHELAMFVSEKLATISGVLSTATHFFLRAYKEQGFLLEGDQRDPDRPAVSP